jgi:hypothetical protein
MGLWWERGRLVRNNKITFRRFCGRMPAILKRPVDNRAKYKTDAYLTFALFLPPKHELSQMILQKIGDSSCLRGTK